MEQNSASPQRQRCVAPPTKPHPSFYTCYHTTGFAFIDPTLLMNSSTGQYGFYGDEWEEESDSELGGDLNKDTSEGYSEDGSLQPYSMDYDDPLLYGDSTYYSTLPSVTPSTVPSISPSVRTSETTLVGQSVRETLRQGLEDPEIREEMLKMITKKKGN